MFHSLSSGLHETFLIRNVTKWIDVSFSDLNVSLGSLTLSLTFSVWRSVGSGLVDFSVRRDVAVGDAGSVVRDHQWPAVGLLVVEVYIVQTDVAGMADVEAFGRNGAEHPWFGIYFLLFGRRTLSVGFVIAFGSCGEGGCNHGALFHQQMDVAGQSDGVAGIVAGGQVDGTSAIGGCFLDGTVDSGAVYSLSVGFGTVVFYIIYVGLDCCRAEAEQQEQYLFHHCRGIKVNRFK